MDFFQNYVIKLSVALHPYNDLIGQTAMVFSILQLLSPIIVLNNMRKAKSTLGMPITIFLIIGVLTGLNVRFSQLINDDSMFKANMVGFSISLIYTAIYFHYVSPSEKFSQLTRILGAATFLVLMIAYSKYEDPEKVQTRFGFVVTMIMYCIFTLPIFHIVEALKKKSSRHMPFPMIVVGTVAGSCWLLRGIIIRNNIVILQNIIMLPINLFQLSLFVIYPSQPTTEAEKGQPKKKGE